MRVLLISIIALLSLSSCSKKLHYFTKELQNDFAWDQGDLQKIQFYLSDDIVLQRKLKAEDSRIVDGKIRVIDGSKVEEVVFAKGTPGIVVFKPKSDKIAVSFESGEDKYLMFGPNKKRGGKYMLLAKDWTKNAGAISYNDKTYRTSSESSYASLLVDVKKAEKTSFKSRKAKGRTVRN